MGYARDANNNVTYNHFRTCKCVCKYMTWTLSTKQFFLGLKLFRWWESVLMSRQILLKCLSLKRKDFAYRHSTLGSPSPVDMYSCSYAHITSDIGNIKLLGERPSSSADACIIYVSLWRCKGRQGVCLSEL